MIRSRRERLTSTACPGQAHQPDLIGEQPVDAVRNAVLEFARTQYPQGAVDACEQQRAGRRPALS
jgi:hypothetical protein